MNSKIRRINFKNWGRGGYKYVHRKVFLELKRIFILKEISIILSKLFTLCSTRKRRFNKFESNHDDKS